MNIFDIAKQFFIVVDKVGYEEVAVFEPDNGIITAQTMLSEDDYQFSVDTQAELWDNGKFYVKSVEGENVPFIAYRKVDWKKDMPESNWEGTFFADPDELEHDRLDAEERPDRDCDPDCTRRLHPAAECDCSRSE